MKLNMLAGLAAATFAAASLAATEAEALAIDFGYTGAAQSWVVPDSVVSIQIEVWGASGYTAQLNAGGEGGYTIGTLSVTPGEILWIVVGGQGLSAGTNPSMPAGGGFNGGGDGLTNSTSNDAYAGGGGGGTDVRQGGDALTDRVIVAGGGGGATGNSGSLGGDGGGLSGETGGSAGGDSFPGGAGGTQTTAGLNGGFGFGGSATLAQTPWNGGGGGGWYGGGTSEAHAGGGGGSSYIGGVIDGEALRGGNVGDGMARFTYEMAAPVPAPAAGLLLAGGIAALGVLRRRKAA
ncbi:glycine-rich protein [Albimonas pacifica]|uniref:receptor protein-tyrosine kinase n=1 Tax=Albimonas pacifica TaxID=1114924 RepID=A0A1I3E6W2_9RHOB|nr:glycine-rich protein [Albimonas pacifica]SFH94730.1 VPLPA-CTERM protein sorting domain-containing protein [Albimonas pacifica]